MHAYYAQSPQYYGQPPTVLRPLAPPGAPSERRRNRNPRRDVPVPENVETVPMCFKRAAASQTHGTGTTLTRRRPRRCGWRNCRRVHPRRCTGAGGPCTICGTTSHATKYHIEFERYIAVRKPRPPTEPEGEDIEAMMRGVGLSDPPQPEGDIPPPGPRGPPGHL